jgi:hypothetical protein
VNDDFSAQVAESAQGATDGSRRREFRRRAGVVVHLDHSTTCPRWLSMAETWSRPATRESADARSGAPGVVALRLARRALQRASACRVQAGHPLGEVAQRHVPYCATRSSTCARPQREVLLAVLTGCVEVGLAALTLRADIYDAASQLSRRIGGTGQWMRPLGLMRDRSASCTTVRHMEFADNV